MDDTHQRFAGLLHRAAALWRVSLDERLRPWDMSQATWRTLLLLRQTEQDYNQTTLASRLGVETPTLVRLLDRMERLGLVRRVPDPQDRRQKYVRITDQGMQLAGELEGEVASMRDVMLAGIPEEELVVGLRVLEAILANGQTSSPGP